MKYGEVFLLDLSKKLRDMNDFLISSAFIIMIFYISIWTSNVCKCILSFVGKHFNVAFFSRGGVAHFAECTNVQGLWISARSVMDYSSVRCGD